MRQASAMIRGAAPIAHKSCLEVTLLLLLISRHGNCLAATQLRPADDEERQLHRRTQAREIGGTQLTRLCALRIVITHDACPCCIRLGAASLPGPRAKRNKSPRWEPGDEGHHHEHLLQALARGAGASAQLTTQQRVCAVLSATPCSGFRRYPALAPAGAARVEFWRRFSEDRYRCFPYSEKTDRGSISFVVPEAWLLHTNPFVSGKSKMRSGQGEITLVQRLGEAFIFLNAGKRKVARHP